MSEVTPLQPISDPTRETSSETPRVTVVVPVFNMPARAKLCIEALLAQTYPRDSYDIIIVDNGSQDTTVSVIQQYPVTLLIEDRIQSPYAARNKGIQHADSEIIALTDATCIPSAHWLESGIRAMQNSSSDLVAGKITFSFSSPDNIAEMFDSIGNVEVKNNVEIRGVGKGPNLFVHRRVFEKIGLFPGHQRSGGDVLWTGKATRAGFKMVYAPEAEVFYPARKLWPLLKKQLRVGKGQPSIWLERGDSKSRIFWRILLGFRPPRPSTIRTMIQERGTPDMEHRFVQLWLVAWLATAATNLGRVRYFWERGSRNT
jgi:glycosyltransferase AglE